MQTLRLSTGAAALAVGSLAFFSIASPALAHHKDGHQIPPGQAKKDDYKNNCPNPAGNRPPGQCKKAGASSTGDVRQGETTTFNSGSDEFDEESTVTGGRQSTYKEVGKTKADATGNATMAYKVDVEPGRHEFIFRGTIDGIPNEVRIPFTVVAAGRGAGAGAGAGGNSRGASGTPSSLPFTGSDDLIPLTAVGLGMVALGAGVVVASRRRRSEMDVSNVA